MQAPAQPNLQNRALSKPSALAKIPAAQPAAAKQTAQKAAVTGGKAGMANGGVKGQAWGRLKLKHKHKKARPKQTFAAKK